MTPVGVEPPTGITSSAPPSPVHFLFEIDFQRGDARPRLLPFRESLLRQRRGGTSLPGGGFAVAPPAIARLTALGRLLPRLLQLGLDRVMLLSPIVAAHPKGPRSNPQRTPKPPSRQFFPVLPFHITSR